MKKIIGLWNHISLVKRIIAGLIIGIILGYFMPQAAKPVSILGSLFVGALKSVAPVLVFFIIMSAISQHKRGQKTNMQSIILLYLLGTFLASLLAVFASLTFPVTLELSEDLKGLYSPPKGVSEVLLQLLMNLVDNPIHAIANANYIGILAWSILLGLALQHGSDTVKTVIGNFSEALTKIVRWIISTAPFGIMGLVYNTIAENGISALSSYGQLLALLVGCMLFMAFLINPLIVFVYIRQNPYPLVLRCLKDSGITAFFTRSSAANIPVNMNLCKELGLNKDIYSVSIPLGATINMAGAAITISVLTLSAAHTLHIQVDFGTALMLSLVAAVSACGASGVAGGSLLLIPLACSLFQIPNDIAMKVAGAGFVVGVIQDSCETALNSSTDALFTALSEFTQWKKDGKTIEIPSGKIDPVMVNA